MIQITRPAMFNPRADLIGGSGRISQSRPWWCRDSDRGPAQRVEICGDFADHGAETLSGLTVQGGMGAPGFHNVLYGLFPQDSPFHFPHIIKQAGSGDDFGLVLAPRARNHIQG